MIKLCLVLALAPLAALGEGQSKTEKPKVHVLLFDNKSGNKEVAPKEVVSLEDKQINPLARDELFEKLGIKDDLKDFDELEKNLLILRSKEMKIARLTKLYPKIPKAKLKALIQEWK